MQSTQAIRTRTSAPASVLAERLPALLVMAIGLVTVYAVGFSPFTQAHNAAHDTRHANGFPCH